jgi:hypothetical protein
MVDMAAITFALKHIVNVLKSTNSVNNYLNFQTHLSSEDLKSAECSSGKYLQNPIFRTTPISCTNIHTSEKKKNKNMVSSAPNILSLN